MGRQSIVLIIKIERGMCYRIVGASNVETERTGWHRKVERWLDEKGISYMSEYTGFPPYKLDVYLPEIFAGLEIDGPMHLSKKDRERDEFLACRGVYILHLPSRKGLQKEKTMASVLRFIEFSASNAKLRKVVNREMLVG